MTEDRGEQDKQQARVSVHADGGLMQSCVCVFLGADVGHLHKHPGRLYKEFN